MRGCILTCDQNGCNEAQRLDSQHVAVISGGVKSSISQGFISSIKTSYHREGRGQKVLDANAALVVVSL